MDVTQFMIYADGMLLCDYGHHLHSTQIGYHPASKPKERGDLLDISEKRTKQEQAKAAIQVDVNTQLNIVKNGDLCLKIEDPREKVTWRYRVSSQTLSQKSPYFRVLLQAGHFSEGVAFQAERQKLLEEHYDDLTDLPITSLPVIRVADFGAIPIDISPSEAFEVMLHILHDSHRYSQPMRMSIIAVLAIIADRFEISRELGQYLKRQRLFVASMRRRHDKILSKPDGLNGETAEESLRQLLLVSLVFGIADTVTHCSSHLLISGSKIWDSFDPAVPSPNAMWWDLPHGLEEELLVRRTAILATLASLQQHFITLYSSPKTPQCTLGYDTSPACDSFQLGEMIRFFSRCKTLQLSSAFYQPDADLDHEPRQYTGNLLDLYNTLKSCPSPQIDSNHKHCGLRSRFVPALEHIFYGLADTIEVCGECWIKGNREHEAWTKSPAGGVWKFNEKAKAAKKDPRSSHAAARAMFTAERWDWTPKAEGDDAGLSVNGVVAGRRWLGTTSKGQNRGHRPPRLDNRGLRKESDGGEMRDRR